MTTMQAETVQNRTEAALEWARRQPVRTRNAIRAWMKHWLQHGRGLVADELARLLGLARCAGRVAHRLAVMEREGRVIRRVFAGWRSAIPRAGISPRLLLDGLGEEFEAVRVGRDDASDASACPTCGSVRTEYHKAQSSAGCQLCAQILTMPPGHLDRLLYLARRAEAGLPLFDPPPPWVVSLKRDLPPALAGNSNLEG